MNPPFPLLLHLLGPSGFSRMTLYVKKMAGGEKKEKRGGRPEGRT